MCFLICCIFFSFSQSTQTSFELCILSLPSRSIFFIHIFFLHTHTCLLNPSSYALCILLCPQKQGMIIWSIHLLSLLSRVDSMAFKELMKPKGILWKENSEFFAIIWGWVRVFFLVYFKIYIIDHNKILMVLSYNLVQLVFPHQFWMDIFLIHYMWMICWRWVIDQCIAVRLHVLSTIFQL